MLPRLVSMLPLAHGGKFMGIHGVSAVPNFPVGPQLGLVYQATKHLAEMHVTKKCLATVRSSIQLAAAAPMQAGCVHLMAPDSRNDEGSLELYIQLPPHLWPCSVFPGTDAESRSQAVTDKTGMTENECVDLCLQRSDCQCAVLETKDRWSSSDNHCWIRKNCQPQRFKEVAALEAFISFVKAPRGIPEGGPLGGSSPVLILCLVLILVLAAVTVVILNFLRRAGPTEPS